MLIHLWPYELSQLRAIVEASTRGSSRNHVYASASNRPSEIVFALPYVSGERRKCLVRSGCSRQLPFSDGECRVENWNGWLHRQPKQQHGWIATRKRHLIRHASYCRGRFQLFA
jgi:hypothetical protein